MQHVEKDNVDMLKFILEKHWCEDRGQFFHKAIRMVCFGRHHKDVLQLLLRYAPHETKVPGALSTAATGGSLEIVKLLLNSGSDINETGRMRDRTSPPAFVSALELEHTHMFYYLRDRGAKFGSLGEAVGRAKTAGLDSMLELLTAEGVDIDLFPPLVFKENIDRNGTILMNEDDKAPKEGKA
jgi:hypothetical protein